MWKIATVVMLLRFSILDHTERKAPCNGPAYYAPSLFRCLRNPAKEMPSARSKGVFAYFCRRLDKSKASGSTRTADFNGFCVTAQVFCPCK